MASWRGGVVTVLTAGMFAACGGEPPTDTQELLASAARCGDDASLQAASSVELADIRQVLPQSFHPRVELRVEDCVAVIDPCGRDRRAWFTFAQSNEGGDPNPDEAYNPDISNLTCGRVMLRGPRSDTDYGRVYTLGVAVLNEAGERVDGICTVHVLRDEGEEAPTSDPWRHALETAACEV